ncbi:putative Leucine-rich repeat protein kinase family protein [Hibiscus syriacus]|uniref:non-specific serine/threonine protein kinase n=1 Tax=Hibiscus syriacus TaxID=106335 RepID=A0A6A2XNU9_HIBSY|nr:putative Leucine-rich repeat protein kinase family protein [Hibiscus syriacus]
MGNTHFLIALTLVALLPQFELILSMKSTTNLNSDQLALLALKNHVVVDPHSYLATNWSVSASVCNWIGITCGSRHRRVIALNLSGMNLSGTIPPHVGNLSFLATLNIGNNGFHGSLSKELSNLHRMVSINLTNNNFDGEIPAWFGSYTRLQSLAMYGNNFTGGIPSSLWSLSKLEMLLLFENNLEGPVPEAIGNLSRLRQLYLNDNKLLGPIPRSLFNISSLVEIVLSNNGLFGPIPSLPLLKNSSLETIDLTFNNLTGHLPSDTFDCLPKLRYLYLSYNQLSGTIPMSLFKSQELEDISLSINQFEGSIPKEIGNLTSIKRLYLGSNHLQGEIPQEICNLVTLEELSLSGNQLRGDIPSCTGNLTLLQALDFSSNTLTGEIPEEIGNLANLVELSLKKCDLRGPIPRTIGNLTLLLFFDFSYNHLTGEFPDEIVNLQNIDGLYLSSNNISGFIVGFQSLKGLSLEGTASLPSSIFNSSHLIEVEVSGNSFSGRVPATIGNLRRLRSLIIGTNNFTGESSSSFLSSLANCKDLRFLAFEQTPYISDGAGSSFLVSLGNLSVSLENFIGYGSNIRGSIPAEIGNLRNLINFNLANNELVGSIPNTIGRLRKLQSLSLQVNKLEGTIPYELCHLRSLGFLYLTGNNLTGSLPACLGDLVSLRNLYLASNNFVNSIPSTLTRLIYVLQLNVSSNSLTGALPIDIGNWKVINTIDLSENRLSGEIPSSIGELEDVAYLSLARNRLQGSIPELIGGLRGLHLLDLSRNNFSGTIPKSLEGLLDLEYFNVSFNRLHGEIPLRGPFSNFSIQLCIGNEELCGGDTRLQLPACKTKLSSNKATKLLLCILLPTGSTLLILALISLVLRWRKRKAKLPIDGGNSDALAEWRRIPYHELHQATNGFCESKLLGVGSFGSVYQGTLLDRLNVAVKVFNLELEGAFKSFEVECEVLRNIRHRNLLKIISSCSNLDFKALVLEFVPNGSLEKWLYSHNYFLDMLQRLNVMIDIASALEYLHHGQTIPVVHCDLKPSNVLLDEDMAAHLGDFGIAKLLGQEDSVIQTITLATIGYMAPEYGGDGIVSTKGDVYSFGILLMETFTRKKPTGEMFVGELSIRNWVKELLPYAVMEVVDTNLVSNEGDKAGITCALSALQLALECSHELPEERIGMKEVVAELKKIKMKFLNESNQVSRS